MSVMGTMEVRLRVRNGRARVELVMNAPPSTVSLGTLEFDLTDDAELLAYSRVLNALHLDGMPVVNSLGITVDPSIMEL